MPSKPNDRLITAQDYIRAVKKIAGRGRITLQGRHFQQVFVAVPFWKVAHVKKHMSAFSLVGVVVTPERLSLWDHFFLWSVQFKEC